jgi:hypothetical protein
MPYRSWPHSRAAGRAREAPATRRLSRARNHLAPVLQVRDCCFEAEAAAPCTPGAHPQRTISGRIGRGCCSADETSSWRPGVDATGPDQGVSSGTAKARNPHTSSGRSPTRGGVCAHRRSPRRPPRHAPRQSRARADTQEREHERDQHHERRPRPGTQPLPERIDADDRSDQHGASGYGQPAARRRLTGRILCIACAPWIAA